MRPGKSVYPPYTTPGRTYKFYKGTPIFRFGHGLSYSTFEVSILNGPTAVSVSLINNYLAANPNFSSSYAPIEAGGDSNSNPIVASFQVQVKNTGKKYNSDFVLLAFIIPPTTETSSDFVNPIEVLVDFTRLTKIKMEGGTQTAVIHITARDLTRIEQVNGNNLTYTTSPAIPQTKRVAMTGNYILRAGVKNDGDSYSEIPFVVL